MYGLIGKMKAAPGRRDELIGILLDGVAGMPGCLSYVVAKDASDPDALWITEVWDSREGHAASLQLPAVQEAIGHGRPLIAEMGPERYETERGGRSRPRGHRVNGPMRAVCTRFRLPRSLVVAVGCLLALVSAPSPSAAQTLPADTTVQRILESWVATGTLPGLVVGLLEADGTRRYVAAGDSDTRRPLDEHRVFEIGSITKTFTSLVLARMVEAGDAAPDEPVASFLPDSVEMPERTRPITLLDLATHTSGLSRLPLPFIPADPTNPYVDYTASDRYRFLAGHTHRRGPGVEYEYKVAGRGSATDAGGSRAICVRCR